MALSDFLNQLDALVSEAVTTFQEVADETALEEARVTFLAQKKASSRRHRAA